MSKKRREYILSIITKHSNSKDQRLVASFLEFCGREYCNNTIVNMALRRPPTRIELKADDVEEYDKVRCVCGVLFEVLSRCRRVG